MPMMVVLAFNYIFSYTVGFCCFITSGLLLQVTEAASAIIAASSAAREAELAAMAGAWDGEARETSKSVQEVFTQ